jgi:hypothetical protein
MRIQIWEILSNAQTAKQKCLKKQAFVGSAANPFWKLTIPMLANLGDVEVPYEVDYMIPYEVYERYADKLLKLVEEKSIEELEKVVKFGKTIGADPMSYVLPNIALKIKRGQFYKEEKELIGVDEDAYTYESDWVLFHILSCAKKETFEKLMSHIPKVHFLICRSYPNRPFSISASIFA